MPAYAQTRRTVRPRERLVAFAAVALVQLVLGLALLIGLRVPFSRPGEAVERLVEIALPKAPPPPAPAQPKPRKAESAPKAAPAVLGGSPGPGPAHAPPSVTPMIALPSPVAPSGGGSGTGPAAGAGHGGGAGGQGSGDSGGSELEQMAGEITPRDYPRRLREARIGGVVGVLFRVEPTGLVSWCRVTQSSGALELDALTCRLIVQRFRYRPSTDRFGRPVADEVEGEHEWIAR